MTKIERKIVGYSVVKEQHEVKVVFNERVERPEELSGRTYKLKTPLSESALYITINNCEVNGQLRPFEVFINSKTMVHFQWVVALTRVMSAVFRKGGEVSFLIEELKSVFDPAGGAFFKGKYAPSLVAQIGDVLETHLTSLGLYVRDDSLQQAAVSMMAEKKGKKDATSDGAVLCNQCLEVSVVLSGGCKTCTSCGASSCS